MALQNLKIQKIRNTEVQIIREKERESERKRERERETENFRMSERNDKTPERHIQTAGKRSNLF